MNHPYEQLADLVDGTLDEDDLAGVRAHLETCSSCREDLAHATAGRESVRSLPQAAPPADLHRRVVAAAGGHGHGTPTWYRWAGVAAAAAVVVAIAIALPNVGGQKGKSLAEDTTASLEARGDAGGALPNAQVGIIVEDKNYDAKDLEQLASAVASDTAAAETAPQFASADSRAAGCVSEAFEGQPAGQLARLIQARFEGRQAYIAVYLEGPGAGEPVDTAVVWVAAKDDCSILSIASARI